MRIWGVGSQENKTRPKKRSGQIDMTGRCMVLLLVFFACMNLWKTDVAAAGGIQPYRGQTRSAGSTGNPGTGTGGTGAAGTGTAGTGGTGTAGTGAAGAGGTGTTGTGTSGTGGTKNTGKGSSGIGIDAASSEPLTIDTVKLTDQSSTVIISGGSDISMYYLLVREADQKEPSSSEVKKEGTGSRDGYLSMAPLTADVEYVFYAVAEDKNGNLSEVIKRRGAALGSRGIEVMGHVYLSLQTKDEIDDYTNQSETITINTGKEQDVKSIEYIIADRFLSSEGLIETLATEAQDVNTSAGASQVNISKWSAYEPGSKPGLVRNMLNYIYVKITASDGSETYIATRGIWEDETLPLAMSIDAKADETGASVTVTGSDEESGISKYYLLVRDQLELTGVEPEDVRRLGMPSDDGIFTINGLTKRSRYDLYAVVEDKAGNLSPVKSGNLATEGEVEASSVRTDPDSTMKPGGNSNVAKRTEGVSLTDPVKQSTAVDRIPYIVASAERDYSGIDKIAGWNDIGLVLSKTPEPSDMYIDMNGGVRIPGDVLARIAGKDIALHLIMDDTYIWVIRGLTLTDVSEDVDLGILRDESRIPAGLVNELAGVYPREIFSVENREGNSLFTEMDLKLGKENAGKYANLYYYVENENRLKHQQTKQISDLGYASFTIPEATDYLLLVQPSENMEPESAPVISDVNDSITDEYANTPKSGGKLWILIISLIGILPIAILLFASGERRKDREPEGSEGSDDD